MSKTAGEADAEEYNCFSDTDISNVLRVCAYYIYNYIILLCTFSM
jgi:hypothetical protein